MKKLFALTLTIVAMLAASPAMADDEPRGVRARARLTGLQEVPAIITDSFGRARFEIFADRIEYTMNIIRLDAPIRFAHIHIGQRGVNGGVSAFLCNNTNPSVPPGTPACPQTGIVRGTIYADGVIGPAAQGIGAQDIDGLIEALLSGIAYVNVHSDAFPAGELRGQINVRSRKH